MTVAERTGTQFLEWLEGWQARRPSSRLLVVVVAPAGGPDRVAVMCVYMILGFCCEGPLSSPRVRGLIPGIVDLFARAHQAGVRDFVLTQDSHPADSPEFR